MARFSSSPRYLFALAPFACLVNGHSVAQQTASTVPPSKVETVVVTGSILQGTPEDAALPVAVLSTADLQLQGSPSNVDLIKSLPFVGATFAGDANPLGASRVQGASSINLRGLGNSRTLVLLNGRRLAPITSGTQTLIDTNSLPMAAVQRVEVLKDGGAATYGSDAIAGVVNFITATDYRGVEVDATHAFISDSDGDSTVSAKWGFGTDSTDILLSAGYQHRSELSLNNRDFAFRPYLENPTGWSASGNPGIYSIGSTAATATSFVDPACEALGGQLTPLAAVGTSRNCLHHYTGWENLVDEQEAFELFGQINSRLGDSVSVHLEALYSQINVDEVDTAASSTILNPPSSASAGGAGPGKIAGRFYIPATNPGLRDLLTRYSAAQLGITPAQYASAQTLGVNASGNWRPLAEGGNPGYGGESKHDNRNFTFYRISGGFSGDQLFGSSIHWDINSTFSSAEAEATGADVIVSRLQYALRGLGGTGCTPGGAAATSTAGVGPCQYFNPFSTAVQRNALLGQTNPDFVGNTNDAGLVRWMFNDGGATTTNETLTFEGVVSGKLPWFELPGGAIGWGLGAQHRNNAVKVTAPDLSNALLNPCTDEGLPLSSCVNDPRGINGIFGPSVPRDYDQNVKGVYGELGLPVFDSLDVQLAVRTERHDAGDTTNPRLSARWQVLDGFAVRASAQSTYRAPPIAFLDPTISTTISQQIGANRIPFDSTGNPDLKPETSDNYNFGTILEFGGFSATLDYWQFKLKDQLVLEDSTALVNALFPAGGASNCGNPAFAALQARFSFVSGSCSSVGNIARVNRRYFNGASVDASGIDLSMKYHFSQMGPGDLTLGLDTTYNLEYQVGAVTQFGLQLKSPFDAVGQLNTNIDPRSLPQWRGQFAANYSLGDHNLRWVFHYVGELVDERAGRGGVNDPLNTVAGFPAGTRVTGGVDIKAYKTHDFFYTWRLPTGTTLNLSVVNAFNTDPPLTRNEYSYDPFNASPLGRVYKIGLRQSFQ